MMEALTLEAVARLGLPVALVIYFLIRDHQREKRATAREDAMVSRIQELEREYRVELTSLVISCNSAASTYVATMRSLINTVKTLSEILKRRPCVHPDADFVPTPEAGSYPEH